MFLKNNKDEHLLCVMLDRSKATFAFKWYPQQVCIVTGSCAFLPSTVDSDKSAQAGMM